ncbi:MAG: hypothetical protein QM817_30060 [Archangium sp.]
MKRLLFIASCAAVIVACGKVVFTNERFACATSGDCADGFSCVSGECSTGSAEDGGAGGGGATGGGGGVTGGGGGGGATGGGGTDGGRPAGTVCTTTAQCLGGLTCVDGVCCLSACNSACDTCNQASNPGTCLPSPAGTAVASCNGFACNGSSATCPTTCSSDAGVNACSPGFSCLAPSCSRCWSGVTNSFSMASDPAWTQSGTNTASGTLSVSIQSRANMAVSASAISTDTLPLNDCGVSFALVAAPAAVAGYQGHAVLRASGGTQRPSFGWRFDTRGLVADWALSDGGTGEQVITTTPPMWLRIEHSGGQVRWRTTSGTTFNTVQTVQVSERLDAMKLEFNASFPAQSGNNTVTYEIDSLNLGP